MILEGQAQERRHVGLAGWVITAGEDAQVSDCIPRSFEQLLPVGKVGPVEELGLRASDSHNRPRSGLEEGRTRSAYGTAVHASYAPPPASLPVGFTGGPYDDTTFVELVPVAAPVPAARAISRVLGMAALARVAHLAGRAIGAVQNDHALIERGAAKGVWEIDQ
jgi:hypothetical protein